MTDRFRAIVAGIVLAASLNACTNGTENVLFVTSTGIGIDADAKTGGGTIGYGRTELMVGPAYVDTGGAPPVVASLKSNLAFFSPEVSQLYATGKAAEVAAKVPVATPGAGNDLTGKRRPMFFGTNSTVGLKLGFTDAAPTSITFGYKRQELSIIPLSEEASRKSDTKDRYASVYASINLTSHPPTPQGGGIQLGQFFATGSAAESIAARSGVQNIFGNLADEGAKTAAGEVAGKIVGSATRIADCVQRSPGALSSESRTRLASLVDAQGGALVDPDGLKAQTSKDGLYGELTQVQQSSIDPLVARLDEGKIACN
jgi:hypothetical protein